MSYPRGEDSASSKITKEDVWRILYAVICLKQPKKEVAKRFNISPSLVSMLSRGIIWVPEYEEFMKYLHIIQNHKGKEH